MAKLVLLFVAIVFVAAVLYTRSPDPQTKSSLIKNAEIIALVEITSCSHGKESCTITLTPVQILLGKLDDPTLMTVSHKTPEEFLQPGPALIFLKRTKSGDLQFVHSTEGVLPVRAGQVSWSEGEYFDKETPKPLLEVFEELKRVRDDINITPEKTSWLDNAQDHLAAQPSGV